MHMRTVVPAAAACALALQPAAAAPHTGAWATYNVICSVTRGTEVPVDTITITIGPTDSHHGIKGRWWELAAAKPDGTTFAMRLLSQTVPMTDTPAAPGRILRYILKEQDADPIEYVNKEDGLALLPQFDFAENFLPHPASTAIRQDGFATCGRYLGHALSLSRTGAGEDWTAWHDVTTLTLDPGLIIGTGRNFRDVEGHRVTGRNYTYRPFEADDYDYMIDCGVNYFTVNSAQERYVCRRAVFYDMRPGPTFRYPETLLRSNYLGVVMFMDEPAILMVWNEHVYDRCRRNVDMANLLRMRVRQRYHGDGAYGMLLLDRLLREWGAPLGTMRLREADFPIWETRISTAFYQLQAGCTGIVEEGRYDLASERKDLTRVFGGAPDLTPREVLLLHYAWLRGAARATGKSWGMSIYGQADPAISPLAVTLAYDMGARYIWYWTSDHDHHLPFPEQMALTRLIRAHAAKHPRPPRDELLHAAKAAVAFPEGYAYDPFSIWGSPYLGIDNRNEYGVSDRDILIAGLFEAIKLMKKGVDFDFIIDTNGFTPTGYDLVVHVGRDGSVRTERFRR